jgi:hypothetical protein
MPQQRHLIVFAKTPKAGFAKTRLIPALGAEGSAALAKRLFEHTIQRVSPLSLRAKTALELCVAEAEDDRFFKPWLELQNLSAQWQLTHQQGADLGSRMQTALERALAHAPRAILIGTDAPSLDHDSIDAAFTALESKDAVFAPAFDGGYTLIGLRAPIPSLFHDIDWGSADVMQTSRDRLRAAEKTWHELAPMHDIDEPNDLIHLPSQWQN